MVGHIYGYYDMRKQHSHRTKLSTVHIDDDSKLIFISVHYVIPHLKMFYGDTVHESATPPSAPSKNFLDKTLGGSFAVFWLDTSKCYAYTCMLSFASYVMYTTK